jgi:dienelactone hydrolase
MKFLLALFFTLFLDSAFAFENVLFEGRNVRFTESPLANGRASGWENTINLQAKLFLPKTGASRKPFAAVILLHGSGNIQEEREIYYAKKLADQGIAALVVETYASRKNNSSSSLTRINSVSALAQVSDAYSALKYLSERSDIDSNRIATMGFSMGGYTGYYLTDMSMQNLLSETKNIFAGHISFYPGWQITFLDPHPTKAPLLAVLGEMDELLDLEDAKKDIASRSNAGANIELHVLKSAAHAWEFQYSKRFDAKSPNRKNCRMQIKPNGGLIWREAGNTNENCQSFGYTVGKDTNAQVRAEALAFDFLNRIFN